MKKNLKVIQFLLFLLLNGALASFFRNRMIDQSKHNQRNGILETMSFIRRYARRRTDGVFYAAFIFQGSKEGHDYWAKLSDKWMLTNNRPRWESIKNCFRK